jgi:hypothetical protein
LASDGSFVWAKSFGGSGLDAVERIVLDTQGNIIVAGYFSGMVDFDPDPAAQSELSAIGNTDAYVLKLNSNGDFVWAKSFDNKGWFPNIVLAPQENVIITGSFSGTVDFDPDAVRDDDTLIAGTRSDGGDQTDVYVLKYSQPTLSAVTPNHPHKVVAYPNPSTGAFAIDLGKEVAKVQLRVFNMFGQVVAETTHNQVSEIPLTIAGAVGLYWVEIETSDGKAVFSLVKK